MYDNSIENMGLIPVDKNSANGVKKFLPLIIAVILAVSVGLTWLIMNFGTVAFLVATLSIVAIPAVYIVITQPEKGLLLLLTLAYLIMFFGKFSNGFPIGTVMDVMVLLLIVGFLLKQKYLHDWSVFKNNVSVVILTWIGYNLMEAVNPSASSILAWLYAVRPIAFVTFTYFLFRFYIRDVKFIRTIFKLWIFLSIIGALYALKQEYFGFAQFELDAFKADPLATSLYFIGNHWRKSSIFSDPVSFAYNMVISSILCFCLMTGPLKMWKKVVLGLLGCLFFFAMLYSGTRGAYVIYPVVYVLFIILKYNKKVMLISMFVFMCGVVLIYMPTSNYTLYRFQTAFKPSKDASFNLRAANQKRIQPYIQSHPLGGGVGATGVWGQRFAPYSYLASFPPDSGYVRVAVELGWLGLFLFCTMMFTIMKTGITNYFRIKDPELKSHCLAMTLIAFALNFGNYPQEALVQYPINIYFYLVIALLTVTYKLDKEKQILGEKNK